MEALQSLNYEGHEIEFNLSSTALMVNATEMAKVFGKRVDVFLKSDHAKAFIEALEFTPNGVNSEQLPREKIITRNHRNGTWMHPYLALKFAAWLDPKFEVWVYFTINKVLFGHYQSMAESLRHSALRINRIEELENRLTANIPDYQELVKLKFEERQANNRRAKENRNQLELFKQTF